jgi:hypothetical protein
MSSESPMDTVGATMSDSHMRPLRTYPSGRTCEETGCRVRLSIYNPNTRCGLHADFESVRLVAGPTIRDAHFGPRRVRAWKVAA